MVKPWLKRWLRHPLSTMQFSLTIVVGLGATAALVSLMLVLGFQPLPFSDPGQLVAVWERPESGGSLLAISGPDLIDFRDSTHSAFTSLGAFTPPKFWIHDRKGAIELRAYYIQANIFQNLGVTPVLGRGVLPGDEPVTNDALSPVWISYRLWQSRYGGSTAVIGEPVGIADSATGTNEQRTQIAGVLPPGVSLPLPFAGDPADIWYLTEHDISSRPRQSDVFFGLGRLRPGVSVVQAQAALNTVAKQLGAHYHSDLHKTVVVQGLQEIAQAPARQTMGLLVIGVTLVFLVGCLNLAILMSAEGRQRRREIAIRSALGASRWRLWGEVAAEKSLLALLSLALAVVFASALLRILAQLLPAAGLGSPLQEPPPLNIAILLGFTLFAVLAALLWSALLVSAADGPGTSRALASAGSGLGYAGRSDSTPGAGRWRLLLLSLQTGLGVCLISASALTVRTYVIVSAANLGPAPRQTVLFSVNRRDNIVPSDAQLAGFNNELLARLKRLPGTQLVAQSDMFPPPGFPASFTKVGDTDGTERVATQPVSVSTDYFRTLGIPILFGRSFNSTDSNHSPLVAIISLEMARKNWPSPEQAVGSQIAFGPKFHYLVIGVASNFNGFWSREPSPILYLPEVQSLSWCGDIILRTNTPRDTIAALTPQALTGISIPVTISDVTTLQARWRSTLTRPQARSIAMFLLALLGLGLAMQGVYAVAAAIVTARQHELAVCSALGAPQRQLAWSVTRQLMLSVLTGAVLGVFAAFDSRGLLQRLLGPAAGWQIEPVVIAVILLVAAAAAGCYFPVRLATRANPVDILRQG